MLDIVLAATEGTIVSIGMGQTILLKATTVITGVETVMKRSTNHQVLYNILHGEL